MNSELGAIFSALPGSGIEDSRNYDHSEGVVLNRVTEGRGRDDSWDVDLSGREMRYSGPFGLDRDRGFTEL